MDNRCEWKLFICKQTMNELVLLSIHTDKGRRTTPNKEIKSIVMQSWTEASSVIKHQQLDPSHPRS